LPEEFVQQITDIALGAVEGYEDFTGDVWQSQNFIEDKPQVEAIPGYQPDNQLEVPVPRIPDDAINIADYFKPVGPGFSDIGQVVDDEMGPGSIDFPIKEKLVRPRPPFDNQFDNQFQIPQEDIDAIEAPTGLITAPPSQFKPKKEDYLGWDDFEELPEGWEWQLVDGNWEAVNTDYSDPSTWDLNNDGSIDLLDQLMAISQGLPQEIVDQITNYSLSPDLGTVLEDPEYLQEEIEEDTLIPGADKPWAEELPEGWEWQFVNGNWEPVELDPEPEEDFGTGTVVGVPEYLQEETTLIPETDKPWTEELPEGWQWQQVDGNWEPVKIDDLDIVDIGEDPGTGTVIDAPEYLQEEVPADIDKTYIHWLSNFNPNDINTWDYNNDGAVDLIDIEALIQAGAPEAVIDMYSDYFTTGEIPEGLDELPEGWEWQQIDGNWEAVNVDYSDISSWDLNNDGSIDMLDQIAAVSQGLPEEIIQQMTDYIAPPNEGTVVDVPEYLQEPDKPSPIYEGIPMMPSDELPFGYQWNWNPRFGEWEPIENEWMSNFDLNDPSTWDYNNDGVVDNLDQVSLIDAGAPIDIVNTITDYLTTPQEQEIIEEGPGGIGQEVIGGIESETGQTVDVPEYLQEPEDMYGKLPPEDELPHGWTWDWNADVQEWEPVQVGGGQVGVGDFIGRPPSDELPEGWTWEYNEETGEWLPVGGHPEGPQEVDPGWGGLTEEPIIKPNILDIPEEGEYLQAPLKPLDPGPESDYIWGPGYSFTQEYQDWEWGHLDLNNDGVINTEDWLEAVLSGNAELTELLSPWDTDYSEYEDFTGDTVWEESYGYVDPDEPIDYPWDPELEWQYSEETGEWDLTEAPYDPDTPLPGLEPEYWNPAPHTAAPFTLGDWADIPYEYQEYMQQIFPELLGGAPLGMPTGQTDFTSGVNVPFGDAYNDWYNAMYDYFHQGFPASESELLTGENISTHINFEQWIQGMGSHLLPADLQHLADPYNIDPIYGNPPTLPEDAEFYNIPFDPYDIGGLTLAMAIEMGWNPVDLNPYANPDSLYGAALSNLSQYAEWDPSMLRALSPDMIDKLSYGYYDPIMESARGQAMQQTMQQYGGGYGDVLNVGAYEDMLQSQIDAGLMSGYEDILGMQQAAGQEVTGVMDEWAQLLAQLQGGIG